MRNNATLKFSIQFSFWSEQSLVWILNTSILPWNTSVPKKFWTHAHFFFAYLPACTLEKCTCILAYLCNLLHFLTCVLSYMYSCILACGMVSYLNIHIFTYMCNCTENFGNKYFYLFDSDKISDNSLLTININGWPNFKHHWVTVACME